MANRHGDFVWYELATPDAELSGRFYAAVVGWRITPAPVSAAPDYRLAEAEGEHVAGLRPDNRGVSWWSGYVGVDDVDAAASAAGAAGATSCVPPTDIPGVGRFAVMRDPQGAIFAMMRGASDTDSHAFAMRRSGHVCWNELTAPRPGAAHGFYGTQFGWATDGAMSMGPAGDYTFLSHGGRMIGATMPGETAFWTFYIAVPDIDAAVDAIGAAGGTVLQPPVEIPGGDHALVAQDPQGARFGLVGPRLRKD